MNAEEVLTFDMEATSRTEEDGETFEKSIDTEEFDVQKHVNPEIPEMDRTDGSEGGSGDSSSSSDTSSSADGSTSSSSSGDQVTTEASSSEEEPTIPDDRSFHSAGTAGNGLLNDATEFHRQLQIRNEVEELVRELVPEEVENLDAMFVQFAGREEELLSTLHTMRERRAKVRARAAVHKSKARPPPRMQENPRYSRASQASSGSDTLTGSPGAAQGSNLRASGGALVGVIPQRSASERSASERSASASSASAREDTSGNRSSSSSGSGTTSSGS